MKPFKYSKAFQGAYDKGMQAGLDGKPRGMNPYSDKRTATGGVTFSRGFLIAWYKGWRDGSRNESNGGG